MIDMKILLWQPGAINKKQTSFDEELVHQLEIDEGGNNKN